MVTLLLYGLTWRAVQYKHKLQSTKTSASNQHVRDLVEYGLTQAYGWESLCVALMKGTNLGFNVAHFYQKALQLSFMPRWLAFLASTLGFPLSGHHKDTDIEEKDMDDEMKELHEIMAEAEEGENDVITEDFISELN